MDPTKFQRVGIILELSWPFRHHTDIFAGTQRFAQEQPSWRCEIDEFPHQERRTGTVPIGTYDGLLGRANAELAEAARRGGIPLVNVWFNSPARDQLPGIFPDFRGIGREAATHLIERGYRRFGSLSAQRDAVHEMMVAAFKGAVAEVGAEHSSETASLLYYTDAKAWARFQGMLDEWIESWTPPVGIFVAFSDVTVRYLAHACHRHGLSVPEDIALITPANEPSVSKLPAPSISSIEVDYNEIGYRAAKLLDDLMRGESVPRDPAWLAPTGVIARDSTDFVSVDDEVVAAAMRFIGEAAAQQIGVSDVAVAAGVGRRTLERRFQTKVGRSVSSEIRRLRILTAKRLLLETDMTLKEVAWKAGFHSPARLNEIFRREVKRSPTDYRRGMRGS